MDSFHYESTESDIVLGPDSQLREDLADAMRDCAAVPIGRDSGERNLPFHFLLCGSVFQIL